MSTAQSLYADSKARLSERIQGNVNSAGSIARQIVRGSKSNEIITHAARNFALQDYAIENTDLNLKKMENVNSQIRLQLHRIRLGDVDVVSDRLDTCLRKADNVMS